MEITEVKVKLMAQKRDRLQAFCTITMDDEFVIRDLKIIEGAKGYFVAMPSRKLADKCPKCGGKNHLRAKYCCECGGRLNENRAPKDERGRAKLHADIAHPINSACRERMQTAIVEAFTAELERAKEPGYVPISIYDDEDAGVVDEPIQENTATEMEPAVEEREPEPTSTPTEMEPVVEVEAPAAIEPEPSTPIEPEPIVEEREPEKTEETEPDTFGKGIFS